MVVALFEFSDGGPPEKTVLFRGSMVRCNRISRQLKFVPYGGVRPVLNAIAVICRPDQLEAEHPELET